MSLIFRLLGDFHAINLLPHNTSGDGALLQRAYSIEPGWSIISYSLFDALSPPSQAAEKRSRTRIVHRSISNNNCIHLMLSIFFIVQYTATSFHYYLGQGAAEARPYPASVGEVFGAAAIDTLGDDLPCFVDTLTAVELLKFGPIKTKDFFGNG